MDASKPRVTVVVPLYNCAAFIGDTVQSVVDQTFTDWDMVLIDDGSTDAGSTVKTAEAEAARRVAAGWRVRVLRQRNLGVAAARNAAIAGAAGEFILPLDCDDIITKDFLQRHLDVLEGNPQSMLAIADLKSFGREKFYWSIPTWDSEALKYHNMFHCSALIRRSLFTDFVPQGYPTTVIFGQEDYAFWIAAQQRVNLAPQHVSDALLLYRKHPEKKSMADEMQDVMNISTASMRILFPNVYSRSEIIEAHNVFISYRGDYARVHRAVAEKVAKFPQNPVAHLMEGLTFEGMGSNHCKQALRAYGEAKHMFADVGDWQATFRFAKLCPVCQSLNANQLGDGCATMLVR